MSLYGAEIEKRLWDAPSIKVRAENRDHTNQWSGGPRIIRVCSGVFVAFAYGMANSICLEMDDSLVIVDTIFNANVAERVLKDFKKVTNDKPVSVIVITHFHADHIMGIDGFLRNEPNGGKDIRIYAHEGALDGMKRTLTQCYGAMSARNIKQFGCLQANNLDDKLTKAKGWHFNNGIGQKLDAGMDPDKEKRGEIQSQSSMCDLKSVKWIESDTILDGFTWNGTAQHVEILTAPGETDDQVIVYLPERKALCCADDFYYAFPNLYAIRGTVGRNCPQWVRSLDRMIQLNRDRGIDYMLGSHSLPEYGRDHIEKELILYRDTIQFIHDQSLRGMNMGVLDPDELVRRILKLLPKRMDNQGRVQQFYGTIEWSVRSVYNQYLGWFEGTADRLYPASKKTRGQFLMSLMEHVDFQSQFSFKRNSNFRNPFENVVSALLNKCKQILEKLHSRIQDKENDPEYRSKVAFDEERFVLEMTAWFSAHLKKEQFNDERRHSKLVKRMKRYKRLNKRAHLKKVIREIDLCEDVLKSRKTCIDQLLNLKWRVMRDIAGRSWSSNGRNWLTMEWLQEEFGINYMASPIPSGVYPQIPVEWLIESMPYWVDPLSCDETVWDFRTLIIFTDYPKSCELIARDGIIQCITRTGCSKEALIKIAKSAKVVFRMTVKDWKEKKQNDHVVKGTEEDVIKFWSFFQLPTVQKGDGKENLDESDEDGDDLDDDDLNENGSGTNGIKSKL